MLLQRFHAASPRGDWASRGAALRHVASLVRMWPQRSWEDLRGIHVVLGAAGSGKTTLVLKTAAAAAAAGRKVAALALFPEGRAQAAAFMAAAEELGVAAAIVSSPEAWSRTLRHFESCDALVVDTPCFISDPDTPRRLLSLCELRDAGTVLHYALCLHHGRDFLLRQLHLALAHGVDFLALPQADLAPGLGALLDLELHAPRPISILNARAALASPLVSFDTGEVLRTFGCTPAD